MSPLIPGAVNVSERFQILLILMIVVFGLYLIVGIISIIAKNNKSYNAVLFCYLLMIVAECMNLAWCVTLTGDICGAIKNDSKEDYSGILLTIRRKVL